ncbi:NRAMP family divalent metal transporter [Clostridium botulinum]|uniref:NRAMP family divalent metal transporter n=1 Tax=Clostridium botulinum TaxID=1491 RepID=UPI0004D6B0F2|nr:NRAMP family divalent metal transporter [Clostridium botulinum]KEI01154.1 membrane protein [Clostridium botulinum C/D str. BKT75002]KEI13367.1 membrane protein [Clostridium botulinum C/D str. BKT2873]QPW61170.1 divalent metal cation transporter [Clostridium botulinum]
MGNKDKRNWSVMLGAAFLMATSAIGPGFLTQSTTFTGKLGASFGFIILISIIFDIGAQLNIWRIIIVSKKRGQEIANLVIPGLGYFISGIVVLGGLAFNIGNIGGAGLGLNVLFNIDEKIGAIISAVIAIGVFLIKDAQRAMDRFAQIMGLIMIVVTLYIVGTSHPPVTSAVVKTFLPEKIDMMAIITLVGGTVGGYITFVGGHRLLDAGITGEENISKMNRSCFTGIGIASLMRIFLFLATLGIIAQGFVLDPMNPPASVFKFAAGNIGYKIFGIVMWSAAITSVIGSAYTSVSFIKTFGSKVEKNSNMITILFIILSTIIFVFVGKPVKVMILVGALNGLILPITLGTMLIAAYKKSIVGNYKHPMWMAIVGGTVVIVMTYLGVNTLIKEILKVLN